MMNFYLEQEKGMDIKMNNMFYNPNSINGYTVMDLATHDKQIYEKGKSDGKLSEQKFPISNSEVILPEQDQELYGLYFVVSETLEKRIFCNHSIISVVEIGSIVKLELEGRNGRILLSMDKKSMNSTKLITELQIRGVRFANMSRKKLLQYFLLAMSCYGKKIQIPDDFKPGWYETKNTLVFFDCRHEYSQYIPELLEARYFEEKENIDVYLKRCLSDAELLLTLIRLIPVLPNKKNVSCIYIETDDTELIKMCLQIYSSKRKNTIDINQSWNEIKKTIKGLKNEPLFIIFDSNTFGYHERKRTMDNINNIKNLVKNGYFENIEFQGTAIFLGDIVFSDDMKNNVYYIPISKKEIKRENMYIDIIRDFISLIIEQIEGQKIKMNWLEDVDRISSSDDISMKINLILQLIMNKYQTKEVEQKINKILYLIEQSRKKNLLWHEQEGVDEMFILKFLGMIKKKDVFRRIKKNTGEVTSFQQGKYNLFYDQDHVLIDQGTFKELIGNLYSKNLLLEQLALNEWLVLSQKKGRKYTQQKSVMIDGNTERKYFLVFDRKKLEEAGLELYDSQQYFI